jgi:hypothetical protein
MLDGFISTEQANKLAWTLESLNTQGPTYWENRGPQGQSSSSIPTLMFGYIISEVHNTSKVDES